MTAGCSDISFSMKCGIATEFSRCASICKRLPAWLNRDGIGVHAVQREPGSRELRDESVLQVTDLGAVRRQRKRIGCDVDAVRSSSEDKWRHALHRCERVRRSIEDDDRVQSPQIAEGTCHRGAYVIDSLAAPQVSRNEMDGDFGVRLADERVASRLRALP